MVICPACQGTSHEVLRTAVAGTAIRRRRECKCGCRWTTREDVEAGSVVLPQALLVAPGGPPEALPVARGPEPPGATNSAPPATNSAWGVGGGLPSGSGQIRLLPALQVFEDLPDQTGARGKRRAVTYSPAFETLWDATGRRGHKEPAQKAWIAAGRPDPARVALTWTDYLASLPDWRQPKDLSGWLNVNGHAQDWRPAPRAASAGNGVHDEIAPLKPFTPRPR